ncbi:hypothetical protein EHZ25_25485 [Paraburkholderia tropica]|nr:hypothetical protein EHZ25_25485 [Paraburkholderia tropica]
MPLQGLILTHGYVTTRVLLPTQDLSKGELKFALIPGVIRHLKFDAATTRGTLKTAFPARDGGGTNTPKLCPRRLHQWNHDRYFDRETLRPTAGSKPLPPF